MCYQRNVTKQQMNYKPKKKIAVKASRARIFDAKGLTIKPVKGF